MIRRFWLWRLLSWFWRGLVGHFHDPGPLSGREKQGYIVWGPVVLAILTVEGLGAFWDKFHDKIPTISSTVGHLETYHDWVAVIVVGVITIVAFLAVAYRARKTGGTGPEKLEFSLSGLLWDELVVLVVVLIIVAKLSQVIDLDKHQMGYTVYGVLAVFGVVVPSIRALAVPGEPTLLSMVRSLRGRLPWLTVVLISGLTILVVHLAFYPWPDIPHDSAKIGNLNGLQAIERAKQEVHDRYPATTLDFRTVKKGRFAGYDAWLVYFDEPYGFVSGCVAAVKDKSTVTLSSGCSS